MKKFFIGFFVIMTVLVFQVVNADNQTIDQVRFEQLAAKLRCLVCQNETLADSTAPLAVDLKKQMIMMMQQGKSDQEIIDYLTQRYGEFVLFKPTVSPKNYVLWFGPFGLLMLALVWFAYALRQRKHKQDTFSLTDEEKQRLEQLLK